MVSDQLMKILSKENAVKFSKLNIGNHFIPLYRNTPSWASAKLFLGPFTHTKLRDFFFLYIVNNLYCSLELNQFEFPHFAGCGNSQLVYT